MNQAFKPYKCNALVVSASTTHNTSALVFPTDRAPICQVYVRNQGAVDAWVRFGPLSTLEVTAGTNGVAVPANGTAVMTLDGSDNYASTETVSSTATVVFQTGEGF